MGRGGMDGVDGMISRSMGVSSTAKVDDLPFGEATRLVRHVPVGGVDCLRDRRDGWKAEDIFALSAEQGEALNTLRGEYKDELAKLQTEYDEAQKALAEKVKALRLAYETRANDVLTDPAKVEKLKLDALAKEFSTQSQTQSKERIAQFTELRAGLEVKMAEAREKNNWQGVRDAFEKIHGLTHEVRDQRAELGKSYNDKMLEAVTGAAKEKLGELLKEQETDRRGRGRGGPGGRGGDRGGDQGGNQGGGETQKPPAPPGEF
jgi:hypothetical protein